ncbi:MAG: Na+-transporting methylmalonyl-CoA/oxaloacetate decarboxylase gamma subunit [Lentimonas sp.]|jgi:Na+-transporting methylmalonyl-CoA/oxaloacetate decarboxylase gamma subunit
MNNLDLILAVSGPTTEVQASETMEIVVVGFVFVMIVLSLLALVTASIGAVFRRYDATIAAKAEAAVAAAVAAAALIPKPAPVSDPESISCEDEDPVLIAVLAAAVHSVIGDRAHRIVSIRPGGPGWAQEGRRQIFSSHRVR